jgi:hypothetical protein
MPPTPRIFDLIKLNNDAVTEIHKRSLLDKELTAVLNDERSERIKIRAKAKRERRANRNFKLKANGGIQ